MSQNRPHHRGRHRRPRKKAVPAEALPQQEPHVPIRYGVVFFETFEEAKTNVQVLDEKRQDVDQLNIVIHADGNMDDQDLLPYGKVFAGEAWSLIHKRRAEDGWYDEPH